MKIGIVSCFNHHNYGSMLQAYATQMAIEKLGHEAITFNCNSPITYMTQSKLNYYIHKLLSINIVKTKIRKVKSRITQKKYIDVEKGKQQRDMFFEDFYMSYIKLSDKLYNREQLAVFASTCGTVVVGSDMLWHPINVEHDYFTLTYVPSNVNKISYATSIGTTDIPNYQLEIYRTFLSRINYISVREESGVKTISKLGVDKDIAVVLDPTLLFTAEEWMLIQKKEPVIKEKYILCYFLGVNKEHRDFAYNVKKTTGYKIVALQHLDEFVEDDINFGDIKPFDVGPSEFVNLIRNAEYVCTDSFHGTCFSILNHKKFFIMNRFKNNDPQSTNTRLDSLLSKLCLENRRINNIDVDYKNIVDIEIDYKYVDEILKELRSESFNFLKKAIEAGVK